MKDLNRLRKMCNLVGDTSWTDSELSTILARYPLPDANGVAPNEQDWIETYDYNAAASEIWFMIAASLQDEFDFDADGGSYKRSQKFENAMKMAKFYAGKRAIVSKKVVTVPVMKEKEEDD